MTEIDPGRRLQASGADSTKHPRHVDAVDSVGHVEQNNQCVC